MLHTVENLSRGTGILLVLALALASYQAVAQSDSSSVQVEVSGVCSTPAQLNPPNLQADLESRVGFVSFSQNSTGNFSVAVSNEGNINANITQLNFTNITEENGTYKEGSPYDNIVTSDGSKVVPNISIPGPDREGDEFLQGVPNATIIRKGPIRGHFSREVTFGSGTFNTSSFLRGPVEANLNVAPDNGFELNQFYSAHLRVEAECRGPVNATTVETGNFSGVEHASFLVIGDPANEGGANQTGDLETNQTIPEDVNRTGNQSTNQTVPANVTRPGNLTSNQTVPQNFSESGGEDINDTVPEDVNQTGEQGQTVEGDSDQPGQTPNPEPEPDPAPEIEVEPVNRTYTINRGSFGPAALEVRNIGNTSVGGISLTPQTADLPGPWQARNASVGNLSVGENATRNVFVRPPEDAEPRRYVVPVTASNQDGDLDVDYFYVDVNRTRFPTSVEIVEFPPSATIEQGDNQTLPVLVENAGREPLFNVTAELQNAEDCGEVRDSGTISRLDINESASLTVQILNANPPEQCSDVDATLVVSSERSTFAFSDISISTIQPAGLIPTAQRPPFLALIWSGILAAYALVRKRLDLDGIYDIPLLLLIAGEVIILTLLFVESFGFSSAFLPF